MDWRIGSTPQIMYLVTHHQYGLSALIPKTSFPGETACWHHKTCWLFSQPLHYVIQSSNTMLNDTICVMCSCHNTELLFQLAWCNHTAQNVPQNLKNNFVGIMHLVSQSSKLCITSHKRWLLHWWLSYRCLSHRWRLTHDRLSLHRWWLLLCRVWHVWQALLLGRRSVRIVSLWLLWLLRVTWHHVAWWHSYCCWRAISRVTVW